MGRWEASYYYHVEIKIVLVFEEIKKSEHFPELIPITNISNTDSVCLPSMYLICLQFMYISADTEDTKVICIFGIIMVP